MSFFSIPISFAFIVATKYVVGYFDGQLWPGRFIGFATGIMSFAILTSFYMNEGINAKTMISLVLATKAVAKTNDIAVLALIPSLK